MTTQAAAAAAAEDRNYRQVGRWPDRIGLAAAVRGGRGSQPVESASLLVVTVVWRLPSAAAEDRNYHGGQVQAPNRSPGGRRPRRPRIATRPGRSVHRQATRWRPSSAAAEDRNQTWTRRTCSCMRPAGGRRLAVAEDRNN